MDYYGLETEICKPNVIKTKEELFNLEVFNRIGKIFYCLENHAYYFGTYNGLIGLSTGDTGSYGLMGFTGGTGGTGFPGSGPIGGTGGTGSGLFRIEHFYTKFKDLKNYNLKNAFGTKQLIIQFRHPKSNGLLPYETHYWLYRFLNISLTNINISLDEKWLNYITDLNSPLESLRINIYSLEDYLRVHHKELLGNYNICFLNNFFNNNSLVNDISLFRSRYEWLDNLDYDLGEHIIRLNDLINYKISINSSREDNHLYSSQQYYRDVDLSDWREISLIGYICLNGQNHTRHLDLYERPPSISDDNLIFAFKDSFKQHLPGYVVLNKIYRFDPRFSKESFVNLAFDPNQINPALLAELDLDHNNALKSKNLPICKNNLDIEKQHPTDYNDSELSPDKIIPSNLIKVFESYTNGSLNDSCIFAKMGFNSIKKCFYNQHEVFISHQLDELPYIRDPENFRVEVFDLNNNPLQPFPYHNSTRPFNKFFYEKNTPTKEPLECKLKEIYNYKFHYRRMMKEPMIDCINQIKLTHWGDYKFYSIYTPNMPINVYRFITNKCDDYSNPLAPDFSDLSQPYFDYEIVDKNNIRIVFYKYNGTFPVVTTYSGTAILSYEGKTKFMKFSTGKLYNEIPYEYQEPSDELEPGVPNPPNLTVADKEFIQKRNEEIIKTHNLINTILTKQYLAYNLQANILDNYLLELVNTQPKLANIWSVNHNLYSYDLRLEIYIYVTKEDLSNPYIIDSLDLRYETNILFYETLNDLDISILSNPQFTLEQFPLLPKAKKLSNPSEEDENSWFDCLKIEYARLNKKYETNIKKPELTLEEKQDLLSKLFNKHEQIENFNNPKSQEVNNTQNKKGFLIKLLPKVYKYSLTDLNNLLIQFKDDDFLHNYKFLDSFQAPGENEECPKTILNKRAYKSGLCYIYRKKILTNHDLYRQYFYDKKYSEPYDQNSNHQYYYDEYINEIRYIPKDPREIYSKSNIYKDDQMKIFEKMSEDCFTLPIETHIRSSKINPEYYYSDVLNHPYRSYQPSNEYYPTYQSRTFVQDTPAVQWEIKHNLNTKNLAVIAYDQNNKRNGPDKVEFLDENTIILHFYQFSRPNKLDIKLQLEWVGRNYRLYSKPRLYPYWEWTCGSNIGKYEYVLYNREEYERQYFESFKNNFYKVSTCDQSFYYKYKYSSEEKILVLEWMGPVSEDCKKYNKTGAVAAGHYFYSKDSMIDIDQDQNKYKNNPNWEWVPPIIPQRDKKNTPNSIFDDANPREWKKVISPRILYENKYNIIHFLIDNSLNMSQVSLTFINKHLSSFVRNWLVPGDVININFVSKYISTNEPVNQKHLNTKSLLNPELASPQTTRSCRYLESISKELDHIETLLKKDHYIHHRPYIFLFLSSKDTSNKSEFDIYYILQKAKKLGVNIFINLIIPELITSDKLLSKFEHINSFEEAFTESTYQIYFEKLGLMLKDSAPYIGWEWIGQTYHPGYWRRKFNSNGSFIPWTEEEEPSENYDQYKLESRFANKPGWVWTGEKWEYYGIRKPKALTLQDL